MKQAILDTCCLVQALLANGRVLYLKSEDMQEIAGLIAYSFT